MAHTTATDAKVMAELEEMIEPWNKACISRDWDALLAMCTDDIAFMSQGEPIVEGKAVRPWLDAFPVVKAMTWSIDHVDTEGDLACIRGPGRQTLVIDGKTVNNEFKFCDVAHRGPDGAWRFSSIIWNMDHE